MKRKIKYTNGEVGDFKIVKDFLPSPEELILNEKNVKITINLKKSSIDYFKEVAKNSNTQYQKVIRSLLDYYASNVA